MQFTLPLILISASLAAAAPAPVPETPSGIYLVSSALEDAPATANNGAAVQKRGIDSHSCYNSGEWMANYNLNAGIAQWCRDHDGMNVPKGKSLNAQYGGIPVWDGSPGVFSAHYTNDNIVSGWVINEKDCVYYMQGVVNNCQDSDGTSSQGGYVKDNTYGSVWVDPNAA